MTIRRFILTFSLLLPMVMMAAQKQDVFTAPSGKTVTITHIKHASVLIEYDGLNIYVDPVGNLEPKTDFSTMPKANIVLVTHEHLDHFDNLAIARLASPATAIYANKAVTVVWGLVAGLLFFQEPLTPGKICGAILVIAGVILFAFADGEAEKK